MYQMNEGKIIVPEGWRDESMNVFICPDDSGINLTISRSPVSSDALTEDIYTDSVNQFRTLLEGYKEKVVRNEIINTEPACFLEYSWRSPEGNMYQAVMMLRQASLLMTFTLTSPKPFTDTQRNMFFPVIYSFSKD